MPHTHSSHHAPVSRERLIGPAAAPDLHLMSWNIRRRLARPQLRSADRWAVRAPRLRALLKAERPTVLGVQEALADQAFFVQESLGENYRFVGHGRGACGGGEGNPIMFDSERLELIDWEQTALSATPHKAGSRSWGSACPRIMVQARFSDRVTGSDFMVINTHLDHLSPPARMMAAHTLRRTAEDAASPAVLTGDFNTGSDSRPLRELQSGGALTETWWAAQNHLSEEWDTFANYKAPKATGRRIDWILASSSFRVLSAAVNAAGVWASDHLPVQAVMALR